MKNLGTLWLVVFISLMGFGVTTVPFPLVAEQMGASDFWKTFGGGGVFSVFQLIATPLWGRYSDAIGRKPILIASLAGSVLGYFWLAYADSLTSLILARAFGGIMSGNLSAAFAYATDVTEPRDRARGLGIVTSAFGIGFAIGPALGGFLGERPDGTATLYLPALVSAALSIVALVGSLFFLKESLPLAHRKPLGTAAARPPVAEAPLAASAAAPAAPPAVVQPAPSAFAGIAARPVLVGLMLASLLISIGGAAMQSVYQFWGRDLLGLTQRDVGLQFMFFATASAIGQAVLIGPLTRRFGEKRIAITASGGAVLGLLAFAAANSEWMVWSAIGLFGLAIGLFSPALTSLVSFEASPRERGAIMGAYNAASSAGRIVGPAMSGPVYFGIGHSAPFVISALISAIAGLLLLRAPAGAAAGGGPADLRGR